MIKYFAGNRSWVLLLIPILTTLHLLAGISISEFSMETMQLQNIWNLQFSILPFWLNQSLTIIFISLNAVLINFVFNTYEFYDRINYLPSILYLFIVSFFPMGFYFGEALLGQTFFILSFYFLLGIKQGEDVRNQVFFSGFFLGLAATFVPVFSLFIFVIFLVSFFIKASELRDYVITIVGFLFPFLWVVLLNPQFYLSFFTFEQTIVYSISRIGIIAIPYVVIGLLIIVAFVKIFIHRQKSSNRRKRLTSILMYSVVFSLLIGFFYLFWSETMYFFSISIILVALILPYAFLENRIKWFPHFLFYTLLFIHIIKFFV